MTLDSNNFLEENFGGGQRPCQLAEKYWRRLKKQKMSKDQIARGAKSFCKTFGET